jgi:hypothetical protein
MEEDNNHFRFKNCVGVQVIGSSNSSKSELLLKIIKYRNTLFWPKPPDVVLWCHSGLEQPSLFSRLRTVCPKIKFLVGLEALKKIHFDRKLTHICVLDDLYTEAMSDSWVNELFYKTAHHCNIVPFLVQQNTYAKGSYSTAISRNCRYLILYYNKRDRQTIERIAKNTVGIKPQDIHEIFKIITENNPYGYLVIDLHQTTKSEFSLLTRIIPDEYPSIYFHVE